MVSSQATERFRLPKAASVVLWLVGWTLLVSQTCPPPPIKYIYDENGRLVAVVDPNASGSNIAVYKYDGAGNLLSIERRSASLGPLILSFAPPCAPAPSPMTTGPPVTISGVGFASGATVTFTRSGGGTVPATVTSVTSTEIKTNVPANAATGPVVVTVGSSSPGRPFTVGCSLPRIDAISPTLLDYGTPGFPVTITGANFSTDASLNRVRFHQRHVAAIGASSATQLQVSLPLLATSGRIAVTTAYGTAASAQDLFVPPEGYWRHPDRWLASEVDCRDRVTPLPGAGAAKTCIIGAQDHIALIVFDGAASRKVSVRVQNGSGFARLQLLNPDGSYLVQDWFINAVGGWFETTAVPSPETYTFAFTYAAGPETLTLTFYDVVDFAGPLVVNDPTPVHVVIDTPGQKATLSFDGNQAQPVTLSATNCSGFGCSTAQLIRTSDGFLVRSGPGSAVLPTTDTYAVVVNPQSWTTGSIDIQVASP